MTRWNTLDKVTALVYVALGLGLGLGLGFRWLFVLWGPLLVAIVAHLADFRVGLRSRSAWQLVFALCLTQALCIGPYHMLGFPHLADALAALAMLWLWSVRDDLYQGGGDLSLLLALVTPPVVVSLGRLAGVGGWLMAPALLLSPGWLASQSRLANLDEKVFGYGSLRGTWRWLIRSAVLALPASLVWTFSHAVACFPGEGSFVGFLSGSYGEQHLLPLLRSEGHLSGLLEQAWSRGQVGLTACLLFTAAVPFTLGALVLCGLWSASRAGAAPTSGWCWLVGIPGAVVLGAAAGASVRGSLNLAQPSGLEAAAWWVVLAAAAAGLSGRLMVGAVPALAAGLGQPGLPSGQEFTPIGWLYLAAWLGLGTLVLVASPLGLAPAVLAQTGRALVVREVREPIEPQWQLAGLRCGKCRGDLPGEVSRCPHCGVRLGGTSTHFEGGRPSEKIDRECTSTPGGSAGLTLVLWLLPAALLSAGVLRGYPWQLGEGAVAAALAVLLIGYRQRLRRLMGGGHKIFQPAGKLIVRKVTGSYQP